MGESNIPLGAQLAIDLEKSLKEAFLEAVISEKFSSEELMAAYLTATGALFLEATNACIKAGAGTYPAECIIAQAITLIKKS